MPRFYLRFRSPLGERTDAAGIDFADLEDAYLSTCATIPDAAQEVLLQGADPLRCAYVIADAGGRTLMEVPFTEILPPHLWRRPDAPWRPAEGVRANRARIQLARDIFARTLSASPIPHALVSLDLELLSLNPAAFAMTGETAERVLGRPAFEAFEGYRALSSELEAFFRLAARGVKSSVTDLYYSPPARAGGEANFWCRALAWPIFDDDGRVLAVVNCASQSDKPWTGGRCAVTVGHEIA